MVREKVIEANVSDAITEKPIKITVKGRSFCIYPPTLGKMQVLSKLYLMLDIDEKKLTEEPHKEAMRVCEDKTDIVCKLMAVSTFRTRDELLDDEKISKRAEFFKWNCDPSHFGTCLLAILTQVDYANFMTSIRLTKTLQQNKPDNV